MADDIKVYGSIGLVMVGILLLAGSLTFGRLDVTAFVAFLGLSSIAFGVQVLRRTQNVWWV
jgi:hypothetical protein